MEDNIKTYLIEVGYELWIWFVQLRIGTSGGISWAW